MSRTMCSSITVSSHNLNSHKIKLRVSNPRTIASLHFETPFESSTSNGSDDNALRRSPKKARRRHAGEARVRRPRELHGQAQGLIVIMIAMSINHTNSYNHSY